MKFCTKCGAKVLPNDKFCRGCGIKFEQTDASVQKNTTDSNPGASTVSSNSNPAHSNPANNASTSSASQTSGLTGFATKMDNVESKIYSSVDKKNGNAKIPYNEAKIFTSSKLIDFSGVVRENNDHEYTKLGGFLAFIVYAGYVGLAISAVSVIISFFLSVVSIGYLGALGGIVILTSLLSLIVYGLALVLEFRFLIKIQNRELDFIHYYIKVLCIFAIVDVIVVFLAFIIELIAGMPASYAFGGFISLFITFGCIAVVVGLTMYYFCKSVRVRTYMGTDAYAKVCPWTRNIVVAQPAISYQNSNVKPQ